MDSKNADRERLDALSPDERAKFDRDYFWMCMLVMGGYLFIIIAFFSLMFFAAAHPDTARGIAEEYGYFVPLVAAATTVASIMLRHPHWPVFAMSTVAITWLVFMSDSLFAG